MHDTIQFLPLVKAYPALSKTYGEVSCIAGVRMGGSEAREWIRLYPVAFRALGDAQQFRKYQPMRVRVARHAGDRRPETRRPDRDSIEVVAEPIPPKDGWRMRRRFVEPLMSRSMCQILERQRADGTSLGVFRPKRVLDLVIEQADIPEGKREIARAWAAQPSLLDGLGAEEKKHQVRELELVPWTFKYRYECDAPGCRTHLHLGTPAAPRAPDHRPGELPARSKTCDDEPFDRLRAATRLTVGREPARARRRPRSALARRASRRPPRAAQGRRRAAVRRALA